MNSMKNEKWKNEKWKNEGKSTTSVESKWQ